MEYCIGPESHSRMATLHTWNTTQGQEGIRVSLLYKCGILYRAWKAFACGFLTYVEYCTGPGRNSCVAFLHRRNTTQGLEGISV